jgi:hypothetical protein
MSRKNIDDSRYLRQISTELAWTGRLWRQKNTHHQDLAHGRGEFAEIAFSDCPRSPSERFTSSLHQDVGLDRSNLKSKDGA